MSDFHWAYHFGYDSSILAFISNKGDSINYKYGFGNYDKNGILQITNQLLLYNEIEYYKFKNWVLSIERNFLLDKILNK